MTIIILENEPTVNGLQAIAKATDAANHCGGTWRGWDPLAQFIDAACTN